MELTKEKEAKELAQLGSEIVFTNAISNNDSATAWALVNAMMDRCLEYREQREGPPRKYILKPIVPKANEDGSISFEEKT